MIEHWQRSVVSGSGEDVLRMAMRRNPALAACSRVEIRTAEAFTEDRKAEDPRRPEDIPRDRNGEEWDW